MGRVTVHVADSMLSALDAEAHNRNISRSQAVAKAIESFISGKLEAHNLEAELSSNKDKVMLLSRELSILSDKVAEKDIALESMRGEVMRLQEEVKRVDVGEFDRLKSDLQVKEGDISRLKTDAELKWRETSQLRSEVSQARRELESTRAKIDLLQAELDKKRTETEQARSEAETLRHDQNHYKSTLELKDKQIGFLEGHVAQLTQSISQLALKPGEEEIKKKGVAFLEMRRD
jgi:chromosome segregation ATPase